MDLLMHYLVCCKDCSSILFAITCNIHHSHCFDTKLKPRYLGGNLPAKIPMLELCDMKLSIILYTSGSSPLCNYFGLRTKSWRGAGVVGKGHVQCLWTFDVIRQFTNVWQFTSSIADNHTQWSLNGFDHCMAYSLSLSRSMMLFPGAGALVKPRGFYWFPSLSAVLPRHVCESFHFPLASSFAE